MPNIRFLTPLDYADMCDIVDTHDGPQSAYHNNFDAPAVPGWRDDVKWFLWENFTQPCANIFGYFDDEDRLVAFAMFVRWLDYDNFTMSVRMENKNLNLPRRTDESRYSEALVDLTNYGLGYFRSEGHEFVWAQHFGTDGLTIADEPNCILSTYIRHAILELPANTKPPAEYHRVAWVTNPEPSIIYCFEDPMPLHTFTERDTRVFNFDPT